MPGPSRWIGVDPRIGFKPAKLSPTLFILFILFAATVANGQQPARREVSLAITVTDGKGHFVTRLQKEHFSVFEKDTQLVINDLDMIDRPVSVVFLFDLSASISKPFKKAAVEAVSRFVQNSNSDNNYLITGFDTAISTPVKWVQGPQATEEELSAILEHTPKNNTALYDACAFALKQLENSKHSRHLLVLFSDGLDNESKLSFNALLREVKRSSAAFYGIGFVANSILDLEGKGALTELASYSGGKVFYPRYEKELLDIIDQLSLEVRAQYIIRFSPQSLAPDNQWHPIKIKLTLPPGDQKGQKPPHFYLRSRPGYYDQ